jgi:hypothetical protein
MVEQFADTVRFDLDQPAAAHELHLLAGELKRTDGPSLVCDQVLDAALSLVGADRGNIQLRHRLWGSLVIAAQSGFDSEFLDYFAVTDDDASACGRAATQRSQIVIADVYTDPGFARHREIATASGVRAVCSTPVLDTRNNVVGVLSTHYERPYLPPQPELTMLRRLGRLLGATLSQPANPINGALEVYLLDVNGHSRPDFVVEEWRQLLAAIAEQTADLADDFASFLETAAQRGDERRRLSIARTERQIAAIQRRNASKLRQGGRATVDLEHLPSLKH